MDIIRNNNQTVLENDEYDSVVYGKKKVKKYWNPKTKTYRLWDSKSRTSIWKDTDYQSLMDNKFSDIGRLFALMQCVDNDNILCVKDKHKNNRLAPINSENQLMKVVGLKKRAWQDFAKKLYSKDILKYTTTKNSEGIEYTRYFINPIITMRDKGITLDCYSLFKESLDKVLTEKARQDLNKHLWEEGLTKTKGLTETKTNEEIFAKYVLNNKPADTFIKSTNGIVRGENKVNEWFTVNEIECNKPRKKENVVSYRNLFLDIDAGRNEAGEYFNLNEVTERKKSIQTILCCLPTPTTIIDTRNGYHCYWSLNQTDFSNKEEWEEIEKQLVNIVSIADSKVCDSVRILRMPNTIHKKNGLEEYKVTILKTNEKRYNLMDFKELFSSKENVDYITNLCEEYASKFPDYEAKKSIKASVKNMSINFDTNERINDIANLKTDGKLQVEIEQKIINKYYQ